MGITDLYYTLFPADFGIFGIIWQQPPMGVRVHRIFLPGDHSKLKALIHHLYPQSIPGSCPKIDTLGKKIIYYFKGSSSSFHLQSLDFTICSPFQKRVLLALSKVPRGWITTYGRIADHLEILKGARAVGTALSHNPFPVVIPCHRTIRSSGDLGGFGGEFPGFSQGTNLKKILLELEGVPVSSQGKVLSQNFYY